MFFIASRLVHPSMVMSSLFVPNKRGIFLFLSLFLSVDFVPFILFVLFSFSCYILISRSITFIDIKSIKCEFALFENLLEEINRNISTIIRHVRL